MPSTTKKDQIANNGTDERGPDLMAVVAELGPKFAERAAKHDADGTFVAENFQ